MPMVMEKKDWIATVANASCADRVWSEMVRMTSDSVSILMPEYAEGQEFQVILVPVSVPSAQSRTEKHSALDMVGYGRKFHSPRSTEAWMQELREGEDA